MKRSVTAREWVLVAHWLVQAHHRIDRLEIVCRDMKGRVRA